MLFPRECGNSRRNVSTDHTWELKVYYEEHDNVCTGRTWQQTSDKSLRTARRADCMRGRYRKKPHETPTLQREKVGVDLFSWEGRDYQVVVDYTSYTDPYLALLEIKNTPTQGLGSSPAQRLLNRRTRTLLPMSSKLLAPRGEEYLNQDRIRLKDLQRQQARHYNKTAKDLSVLEEGGVVRMKPFRQGQKEWEKAVVQRRLDERSYEVDTPQGTYRRNRVHLRRTCETETTVSVVPVLSHDLQRYAAVLVPPNSTTMNETAIDSEPAIIR